MKKVLLLLLTTIYFAGYTQFTISGKVSDEHYMPLYPANVIIDASKGWATQTDFDGNYELTVPAGKYFVLFTYLGKEKQIEEVEVKDKNITLNMQLKPMDTELQIVTITGGKYEKSFGEEIVSIEVVSPQLIENNIAQATEALNKVPGYSQLGESPTIRGGSGWAAGASSRVLFLIDGVPQLSPENGAIYFETLPLENLQQVEVIKGASSALYGSSALNGIINFRTAWPTDTVPYHRITSSLGMYQKFTSNAIKSKNEREDRMQDPNWWWDDENHLPIFMNHTYEYRQRFEKLDVVFGAHYRHDQSFRKDNEIDRFRINGKIRHLSSKVQGLSVGFAWNFAYEEGGQFFFWSGVDRNALIPSDPSQPFNGNVRTDYVQRRATISPFISYYDGKQNKHQLLTRFYNNQSTNFGLESIQTNHAYGEYTFTKENNEKDFTLVTGAAGHYTSAKGNTLGDVDYNATNAAAFVQVEKKFFKKLTFSGGLRVEYNQVDSIYPQNKLPLISLFKKNDTITSPVKPLVRFGFNYEVVQGTYIRGGFGQGFRVPTINEYFIDTKRGLRVVPNANILPEAGWSAELGIKQGVKVGNWQGFFDVAGFYTKYIDLIDFEFSTAIPGAIQAQNLDNAQIYGIELSALGRGQLFGYPLNFLVGYTFINPILSNPSDQRKQSYPETFEILNYRSKHNFKADIETTVKRFTFGFSSIYNSYMINIPITQNAIPGVIDYRELNEHGNLVFDIRMKYDIPNNSSVTFVVKNLFNAEYMQRPGILEAPRNYTLQYQVAF